ncbi:hypothetical protein DFQ27_004832 [Actinomortierella ambigua]|uniref:RRM domain-containing protein n=1 Tax=Actinomortierella ambigua TaxID=1343610 RepID=A0A9P6QHY2_9FUNG|nr:hypothetical protein DFQ27_004832 [Actinomortierella ambigua]
MNRILIRQVSVSSSQLSESSPSPLSHYPSPDKHDNRLIQARFDTAERNGFRRKGDRNPGGRTHDNSKEWSRKGRATNSSNSNNANNRTQPKMFFPASPNPELHPTLYRVFFRSLDNIRTLEEAQVFIGHIKATYGPLLQYQFSRCPETKRYLGYGFMTFQDKSAMENLLRDGYLKVLQKDFEFKRCGMVDKPVLRFNPSGFSGFRTTIM